jgi:hypothetical protein
METCGLSHQSRAGAKFKAQEKIALALLPTPSLQTASISGKILLESISLVFFSPSLSLSSQMFKPFGKYTP